MEEVILTTGLTKQFSDFTAVKNLNVNVKKGEIYGFLGLNGAGKTTTIRMLLGMIRPTSGACFINGMKVSHNVKKVWDSVGYMVEAPASYPELTVRENLELICRLRLLKDSQSVSRVLDQLKLAPYKNKKAKHLSLGNAQRLGIAKALLHQPSILILDEPANGLDPAGIVEIRELLQDLAGNHGTTIFLSSHILSEMAKLATKIGIIHNGMLIQEMETNLLEQHLMKRLLIDTKDNQRVSTILTSQHYQTSTTPSGKLQLLDQEAIAHPEKIVKLLVDEGMPPTMVLVDEEDLESYFLRIIGLKGASTQ